MTPKEKAQELFHKFWDCDDIKSFELANQCALIAVNEMEEVYASAVAAILKSKEKAELFKSRYLQEVKNELEKL